MLLHERLYVEVPRRPAALAGVPPAGDPDLHLVPGPGRYPDLDLPRPAYPAHSPTHLTGLLDDPTLAPAPGTRRREREKPLVPTLYPPATTIGTRPRHRSWGSPRAPAIAARLLHGNPDPRRHTVQR